MFRIRLPLILLCLLVATAASAADLTWTNTDGGNWSNGANWSPNTVPGSGDNAFIINSGVYTVTLDVSVTVGNLTVGGSAGLQTFSMNGHTFSLSGAGLFGSNGVFNLNGGVVDCGGALTVNGPMVWGSAKISGYGPLNVNGPLTITPPSESVVALDTITVNLSGVTIWSGPGGGLYFENGAVVNNLAGAIFTVACDSGASDYAGAGGALNNAGTFRKTGGTGATTLGVVFNDSGTLEIQSGTLRLAAGGVHNGSFMADAGTTLTLAGGLHTFAAGASVSGAGAVVLGGATVNFLGSYDIDGSTLVTSGTVAFQPGSRLANLGASLTVTGGAATFSSGALISLSALNLNGGTLHCNDEVMVSGPMAWGQATLSGSGPLNVNGPLTINPAAGTAAVLDTATLNLGGVTTWSGPGVIYLGNGGVINNLAGAVFTVTCDSLAGDYTGAAGAFNNAGAFRKATGTGATTFGVAFNDSGTLEIQSGTVRLLAGGVESGSFMADAGTTLILAGGLHTFAASASLSGAGAVSFVGATANFLGSYNIGGSTLVTGGTVAFQPGSSVVNVGTNLTVSSGTVIFSTGSPISLAGLDLIGGTLNCNGAVTVNGPASWGQATLSGSGPLKVNGPLTINPTAGTAAVLDTTTLNLGNATTWSGPGVIFVANGGMLNNLTGAVFTVTCDSSLIDYTGAPGTFNNAGTFRKTGGAGATHVDLSFNNLGLLEAQQGTIVLSSGFSPTGGTLRFGLSGPSTFGQLSFPGSATFGGTVSAVLLGGFVPAISNSFSVVTYGSLSGLFTNVDLPEAVSWQTSYGATAFSLVATGINPPLVITGQPQDATNQVGTTASFSVTASGTLPLRYQWQFKGTNLTDDARISGSQSNRLTVANVGWSDAGNYQAILGSANGVATSVNANLTVQPATLVLTWATPAGIYYGAALSGAQLNATANVAGSFAYTPTSGAVPDAGSNTLAVIFTPNDTNNPNRATAAVGLLVLPTPLTVRATDATRPYGGANPVLTGTIMGLTNNDHITVNYTCAAVSNSPPGAYLIVPNLNDPGFRLGNYAVTLTSGVLAVACGAIGLSPATLPAATAGQAYSQGLSATGGAVPYTYAVTDGGLPAGLSISGSGLLSGTPAAMGTNVFMLTATDAYGCAGSQAYTLVVLGIPPSITAQPQAATNQVGTTANFSVTASGTPPLTYQWQFSGTNLTDDARINGSQSNRFTFANVNWTDAGNYQAIVSNPAGAATSAIASLTVQPAIPLLTWAMPAAITYGTALSSLQLNATASVPGLFVYAPGSAVVMDAGTNILSVLFIPGDTNSYSLATGTVALVVLPAPLTVKADNATRPYGGANPVFTGTMKGLTNNDNITVGYTCAAVSNSPPGAYLIVPSLNDPDLRLGNYAVTLTSGTLAVVCGAVALSPATLPTATAGQVYDQNLSAAGGAAPYTYAVTDGGLPAGLSLFGSGLLTGTLAAMGTNVFTLTATDANGCAGSRAYAWVVTGIPLTITTQPQSQAVPLGSNVTFAVAASGLAPLSYQWRENAGNLPEATNALLALTNVQAADAGNYDVVVSSALNSVTSTVATLTVMASNCVPAPAGLTAWWPAEGSAADVGGTNNGVLQNGATFASGEVGQAFSFNGNRQFVQVPARAAWDFTAHDGTIAFWVNVSSLPSVAAAASGFMSQIDNDYNWAVYVYWDGRLAVGHAGVNEIASGGGVISPGVWNLVAVTKAGAATSLYLNGSVVASATTPVWTSSSNPLKIGGHTIGADYYLDGLMDEIQVFNRGLSGSEIGAIYLAGANGECPITATPPAGNYWTNTAGGNWSSPANWSSGSAPGADDTVFILSNGTYTVTVDVDVTLTDITMGGSTGQQTLSVAGRTFAINGVGSFSSNAVLNVPAGLIGGSGQVNIGGQFLWSGGALSGSGTVNVLGALSIYIGYPSYSLTLSGWALNNAGTATVSGTGGQGDITLRMDNGAVINNQAGASLLIVSPTGGGSLVARNTTGATGAIYNNGLMQVTGPSSFNCTVPFFNAGAVQLLEGGFGVGSGTQTGSFTATNGTTLRFNGSPQTLTASASIAGAGTVAFSATPCDINCTYNVTGLTLVDGGTNNFNPGANVLSLGSLSVAGGTVNLNTGVRQGLQSLTIGTGTLGGTDPLDVANTFLWSAGTLSGAGAVNVLGELMIYIGVPSYSLTLSGRVLNNEGTAPATINGAGGQGDLTLLMDNGAVINNSAGAAMLINIPSNGGNIVARTSAGASGAIYNDGLMQVTGASTRWGFVCYVPLVNDAVAQVLSGALHLNGGGLNGGTLLTAADSTLDFPAGTYTNAGYYEIGGSTSIGQTAGSTGVLALASGTFIATNSPVLIGPAGGGVLTISGGNVTLGQVTLGGTTTTASGELSLLAGGHLTILSNASANFIRVDGGGLDGSGGTVIVGQNHSANMVVSAGTATNIGTLFVGYSPGFTGTFTQSGGAVGVTKSLIVGDCGSNSTGVFTMSGGALYITNAAHTATLDVRQGIFLFNGGTLVVDAIVTNGCGGAFINSGGTLIFQPVQPPPVFQVVTRMGNAVTMTWSASASRAYQLQYKTNLNQFAWADLGSVITATNSAASASDAVNPDRQRFYRVVMLP